jgi:hypothetical protein
MERVAMQSVVKQNILFIVESHVERRVAHEVLAYSFSRGKLCDIVPQIEGATPVRFVIRKIGRNMLFFSLL